MTNNYLEEFCASYKLKNLINEPTCFKNIDNPTLIYHILTNHPKSFHSSSVCERGLSDVHKLTLTVLKTFHVKHNLKSFNIETSITLIIHHFEQIFFRNCLLKMFCLENLKILNTYPRKSSIFMLQ